MACLSTVVPSLVCSLENLFNVHFFSWLLLAVGQERTQAFPFALNHSVQTCSPGGTTSLYHFISAETLKD